MPTPDANEEAVSRLIADIRQRPLHHRATYEWPNAPLNVLDCVLSLNRHYDRFAFPRVREFQTNHPEVSTLARFRNLILSHQSLTEFGVQELRYRHEDRIRVLLEVTERLIKACPNDKDLFAWAEQASPQDVKAFGVKGFGLAGFQYLRMLFGTQTFKPDRHIVNHVMEVTGFNCDPLHALDLLEIAVASAGVKAKDLDYAIWLERSGSKPLQSA